VRNLTVNKWGSELGTRVLNDLCKLYMNLIWESSMLLWLCNEEQQQHQLQQLQQFYQLQLQQLSQITGSDQTQSPAATTANSPSSQLAQLIQQFSTTANSSQTTALSTSATAAPSSANFKFNRADLDRLRTYLPPQQQSMLPLRRRRCRQCLLLLHRINKPRQQATKWRQQQ
jgi:hypothetical protein